MTSYISADLRRIVASRAAGLCEYCLIHESDTFLGCEVDHIISEKHGGPTDEGNLAFACVYCNRSKGSDIGSVTQSGQFCRFFNPRDDSWGDHFELNGVKIVPRTDIGAVTSRILDFNLVERLLERQALVIVNLISERSRTDPNAAMIAVG